MTQHELWTAYRRQVRICALTLWARTSKAARRCTDTDELIAAGEWALWQKLASYDPGRGVSPWAYARQRVVGAMVDWLRQTAVGPRRQPLSVIRFSELAHVDATPCDWTHRLFAHFEAIAPHPGADLQRKDEVARQLRQLQEQERVVMQLYHLDGLTMRQCAARVGLSESRVCQILANALNQLREIAGLPPLTTAQRPSSKKGKCGQRVLAEARATS